MRWICETYIICLIYHTTIILRYANQYRQFEASQSSSEQARLAPSGLEGDGCQMRINRSICTSQIVDYHPIISEAPHIRKQYIEWIYALLRSADLQKRLYISRTLSYFADKLGTAVNKRSQSSFPPPREFAALLPIDLIHMLGYNMSLCNILFCRPGTIYDFHKCGLSDDYVNAVCAAAFHGKADREALLRTMEASPFQEYIQRFLSNAAFIRRQPVEIFVTATMSAGKSTLLNALIGQDLNKSQNTACTAKNHLIISKPFDDGLLTKYDHRLLLDAEIQDVHTDHKKNRKDHLAVSTFFRGALSGKRIILMDSPGVNFHGDTEHRRIAQDAIRNEKYTLLLVILNGTQLHTNDMYEHLQFIRENVKDRSIWFVLNHADEFCREGLDSLLFSVKKLKTVLTEQFGFSYPVVFPVSALAGITAKTKREDDFDFIRFSRIFGKESLNLEGYYHQYYPSLNNEQPERELSPAESLLRHCGIYYVEKALCAVNKRR